MKIENVLISLNNGALNLSLAVDLTFPDGVLQAAIGTETAAAATAQPSVPVAVQGEAPVVPVAAPDPVTSTPAPVVPIVVAPGIPRYMTAQHPLNQPANLLPFETRSLKANLGDGNFVPNLITKAFQTFYGGTHLHMDDSMPVNYVDSSKTPDIFVKVALDQNWGNDDEVDVTNATGNITSRYIAAVPCKGGVIEAGSDHHLLTFDVATNFLHELFSVKVAADGTYTASAYRKWDITQALVGKLGQNSADAAGLPIVPFLMDYDEVMSGVISHALRMTFDNPRTGPGGGLFTYPACHAAGGTWSSPTWMGQRLYLRPDFDTSKATPFEKTILTCLQTYGVFNCDLGATGYITTKSDTRWDDQAMSDFFGTMTLGDFVLVNSGLIIDQTGAAAV